MKKLHNLIGALMSVLLVSACSNTGQTDMNKILLFNGNDLSNWEFYLADSLADPAKVFLVEDSVIHITGQPFGYMRTKERYADYILHVEWRWPVEATNSGVFIHTQLPDTTWPRCFECQLAAGRAGDFVCMNGATMAEKTERIVVTKMNESNEKPVGEWNTLEVTCAADSIMVVVNGTLQNKGTQVSETRGSICLQSEGKDIEFRNVYLTDL
ncbi:MAG: DUF1080 domain-containing protein [Bacteroidales bacterium]|nr:DUF1080 domain-containing protein [Bacteroidales bacterium]